VVKCCAGTVRVLSPASIANAPWRAIVRDWRGLWLVWLQGAGVQRGGLVGRARNLFFPARPVPTVCRVGRGISPPVNSLYPAFAKAGFLETSQPGRGVALPVSLR
jgi:hypothetical protein